MFQNRFVFLGKKTTVKVPCSRRFGLRGSVSIQMKEPHPRVHFDSADGFRPAKTQISGLPIAKNEIAAETISTLEIRFSETHESAVNSGNYTRLAPHCWEERHSSIDMLNTSERYAPISGALRLVHA